MALLEDESKEFVNQHRGGKFDGDGEQGYNVADLKVEISKSVTRRCTWYLFVCRNFARCCASLITSYVTVRTLIHQVTRSLRFQISCLDGCKLLSFNPPYHALYFTLLYLTSAYFQRDIMCFVRSQTAQEPHNPRPDTMTMIRVAFKNTRETSCSFSKNSTSYESAPSF